MIKCIYCKRTFEKAVKCNEKCGDHMYYNGTQMTGTCKCGVLLYWSAIGFGDKERWERYSNIRCDRWVCPYCGKGI